MSDNQLSPSQRTVMEILSSAVQQGTSIDVIERLAALQRQIVKDEAELQFNEAMHRAQSKMRRIGTDAANPETHSRYATFAKMDGALRPIYAEEGFSLSFDTEQSVQPETLVVLCYVSRKGHTRTYRAAIPTDGKGPKGGAVMSKTHATGSAMSYGCRYLLKMIFNVQVGETDDDGNGGMDLDEREKHIASISTAPNMDELKARYKAAAKVAMADNDPKSMRILTDWKDARKRELADA